MAALRPPPPTSEATSRSMRSNRWKDTKPELAVRRMLREEGFPGYRLNWKKAPGRPDIAYPGRRVAIFVNGCFWHRCPLCGVAMPKSHQDYWQDKFARNVERDARKTRELEEMGWTVVVVWECRVKKEPDAVSEELADVLRSAQTTKRSPTSINLPHR